EATLATLRDARTVGCFQIETPTMRSTLRKLPLRDRDDLMAALALVRPGPSSGAAKASYIRRARGEEPADPPHPRLRAALGATHGRIRYEGAAIAAIPALTNWPPPHAG